MNKDKKRSIVTDVTELKKGSTFISQDVITLNSSYDEKQRNAANVLMSIKHLQEKYQCFFNWEKAEMGAFWNFREQLHKQTWQQVLETSGRGKNKTGLAYTVIPRNKYPNNQFLENLPKDITLFELRVSGKMRVHGFRSGYIFHLCWLDRSHRITQ